MRHGAEESGRGEGGEGKPPRVERLALAFDGFCEEVQVRLDRAARGHNWQVQRTSASIIANIGEAFDAEYPADKRRYFSYAQAAAGEAERLLRALRIRRLLTSAEAARGLRLLRDIKWDLRRLIGWTKRLP